MVARLAILAVLAMFVAVAVLAHRRRSARDEALGAADADGTRWPEVPDHFLDAGAPRTWLIFTTPMCASCPQVQADLESSFPSDRVVKVDAVEHAELADRYSIRRAPTTLLADAEGSVLDRLVGPEAVRSYIAAGV